MSIDEQLRSLSDLVPDVSRETVQDLRQLSAELLRWNAKINLIGPATERDVWNRHILDSAQLLALKPSALHWLDLGSGGGFPGLVVAAMLKQRVDGHVDLVESNRKKAGFLQTMTGTLALPAHVHAKRIEDVAVDRVEVVTARALAPLPLLLTLAQPWLSTGATGLFHKGRDYAQEIEESARSWSFDLLEHRSAVDPASVILQITNLRRRQV
jgi:16S rRNA (guanine527-N7)-methyltransferase